MCLAFTRRSSRPDSLLMLLLLNVCWMGVCASRGDCEERIISSGNQISAATTGTFDPAFANDPFADSSGTQPPAEFPRIASFLGPFQPYDPAQREALESVFSGLYLFHAYTSWHGVSDGSGGNNNGLLYGANYGAPLGIFGEATGIGFQVGGSYGLYDLDGRTSGFSNDAVQQQLFLTTGLFRKADEYTNFSVGVVYDAMLNQNFGQFAASMTLSQIRGQIGYRLNDHHEIGVWAALRVSDQQVNIQGPLSFRAVDQVNFFWHHKFQWGADGWTSVGFPDQTRLNGHGSLGSYTLGANLTVPLSPRFGAYADLQYMAPSAGPGRAGAEEETFNIGFGVVFFPGANSLSKSVISNSWLPWLPVANNGSFIVDSNRTF